MNTDNLRVKKIGSSKKIKVRNYKVEYGQVIKGSDSMYIQLSGYVIPCAGGDLNKEFPRMMGRLAHHVNLITPEVFFDLSVSKPIYKTYDHSESSLTVAQNTTNEKYTYFAIELTLFFADPLIATKREDEIYMLCSCLYDWLEEWPQLSIQCTRK